jgi:hypothetical protein
MNFDHYMDLVILEHDAPEPDDELRAEVREMENSDD